ncbi:MAG: FAD-dependent monooxygenase, partial [Actinocatenispora sp.]
MGAEQTSVLVVGGGLVGLSAAVFLSWRGVRTVLVERHPGSSPHPRAIGYTPRTRELYRSVGLEPVLPPAPGRLGAGVRRIRVESLAGEWGEEMHWSPQPRPDQPPEPVIEYSPCGGIALAQDRLEPILRQKATELGADVRFGTELLSFTQDPDGVHATIRGADGGTHEVRAAYLLAADGHRSPVRETLGIGTEGRGHLHTSRSVLFRAPLEQYRERGFGQFVLDQPGLGGMLTTYGDGRWVLFLTGDDTERDEENLRELVLRAVGRRDIDVEIITTGRWVVSASIAERYGDGRAFLAGDAAHTLPPNRGGYSANTGIEDAHNLAWKLAAVLAGESTPALLETYEAERRPIAWLCHDQIFAHDDGQDPRASGQGASIIDDQAMAFGHLYRSGAVLGAGDDLPPALRPEQWAGQPGTRAPHVRLTAGDQRLSTLDLFGSGWVLLADGHRWVESAREATARTGITVRCHLLDTAPLADHVDRLREVFGLADGGATLVRPDGYVAWRTRSTPADPTGTLAHALGVA